MSKTDNLNKALFEIQKQQISLKKTNDNPFHKSKYANLSDFISAIKPALNKVDVLSRFSFVCRENKTYFVFNLTHVPSGEALESCIEVAFMHENKKSDAALPSLSSAMIIPAGPQPLGSTATYLMRYLLGMFFCVEFEEDDDGEKTQGHFRRQPPKEQPEPPRKPMAPQKDIDHYRDLIETRASRKELEDAWGQLNRYLKEFEITEKDHAMLSGLKDKKKAELHVQ